MILSDWDAIKHFSQSEKWGDWSKMDREIFFKLDAMREYCGRSIIIHCGYEAGGHTADSQHYKGRAVDIHIDGLDEIEQYLIAERFSWRGIGLYPDWNSPGLHLDTREDDPARWGRIGLEYVALNKDFIKYCLSK